MTFQPIIVGQGLIARAMAQLPEFAVPACFFASGVSNSSNMDSKEFEREYRLLSNVLHSCDSTIHFIYFSTCSVYDIFASTKYVEHKLRIERLISQREKYLIFRLPQVVGFSNNRFTLTNYIRDCILESKVMQIQQNAFRNVIDVDDVGKLVFAIVNSGLHTNSIVNIANTSNIRVTDLVKKMESTLKQQAIVELIDAGTCYPIDTTTVGCFLASCKVDFSLSYVDNLLAKYYSPIASQATNEN